MNLEFLKYLKAQVVAKRSDVANLKDLNLSTCVKMKIIMKELERSVKSDDYDGAIFTKIVDDLTRVMNELAILKEVHYSLILLEKYSIGKRKKISRKNLINKEKRNELKKRIQSFVLSATNDLKIRAQEKQDLWNIFQERKAEYFASESKFLKDAVNLSSKKMLMESEEDDKENNLDLEQSAQEIQSIISNVSLQAEQLDEDIETRKNQNEKIYQTFNHFMEIKFTIDEINMTCDSLDRLIDEALVEGNAESEIMSDVDLQNSILSINAASKEAAFQSEISRLNELCENLNESIQKANMSDNQAKATKEQLRVTDIENSTRITMLESEFFYWNTSRDDGDSDSELEELEEEISEIRKQISEFKKVA